jgi:hypothetical protein
VISTKPGLNRFLRVTPGGLLRVDAAKIAAYAKLDGKYLLRTRTCPPRTSRWAIGSCWRSNAAGGTGSRSWSCVRFISGSRTASASTSCSAGWRHCWRIVETQASTPDATTTWPRARTELQRLHVGTFTGPAGVFRRTTRPSPEVRRLHTARDIALPPTNPGPRPRSASNALTSNNNAA